MKTSIDFLNGLRIAKSANFEKKVIKLLPEGVNMIYLSSCGMERASGYGSYNYFLDVEINNERTTLRNFTHDAQSFDYYQDLEDGSRNFDNWIKSTVLAILEDKKEEIIELISEQND